jgi:hypothetical protein
MLGEASLSNFKAWMPSYMSACFSCAQQRQKKMCIQGDFLYLSRVNLVISQEAVNQII